MIATVSNANERRRWLTGSVLVGGLAGVAALTGDDGPVLCPFRACTGMACPGCGLTRAIAHAARGDLVGSIRLHPLALPLVALLAAAFVLRRSPVHRQRLDRWFAPTAIAVGLTMVAVWLVRWRLGLLDAVV